MTVDASKLFESVIEKRLNMTYYAEIMKTLRLVNVSTDRDFQNAFVYFYRVRRSQEWRDIYFNHFEAIKESCASFQEVLTYLYEKTGNVEPSFTSKLLATLNPDLPIWDSIVLYHLGLELNGRNKTEKLQNAIVLYEKLLKWYQDFLSTDEARKNIDLFNMVLPHYQWLSDTKKIDFLLWGNRTD